MSTTLIGISTFGNIEFTKLAVRSVRETATEDVKILIVVGKSDDYETLEYAQRCADFVIVHERNMGFPASCNDVFDAAWKHGNFDYVILMGNDVIAYPGCIDGLIKMADTGKWDQVCGTQYDVQSLLRDHPQTSAYFTGPNYVFTDFDSRPWEIHEPNLEYREEPGALKDIQNMTLYTKGAFDKLGYFDVNFWPNGYYSDNCYARRGVNAGVKGVGAPHCEFFHAWSRTIHQGPPRANNVYFDRNKAYYIAKYGGDFGNETNIPPQCIASRDKESEIINHWSNLK